MSRQTNHHDESMHSLYDADFHAWTRRTADLLRTGRVGEADIFHIAEEIADMGKRDARALDTRMCMLLIHLLKWQLQPDRRSRSWKTTILAQRQRIARLLQQSPSLSSRLASHLGRNYGDAVELAESQTGLARTSFAVTCPFSIEQLLDRHFLPD